MGKIVTDIKKLIANNVIYYRLQNDWSQEYLAELLDTTTAYLSQIENGKRNISANYIGKLANIFNIEPYQLLVERPPLKIKRIDRIKR